MFYIVTEYLSSGRFYVKSPHYNDISIIVTFIVFLLFSRIDVNGGRLWTSASRLAPYSLGVYLITDNFFVRDFLWNYLQGLFVINMTSVWLIPVSIVIPLLILFASVFIDAMVKIIMKYIGCAYLIKCSGDRISALMASICD